MLLLALIFLSPTVAAFAQEDNPDAAKSTAEQAAPAAVPWQILAGTAFGCGLIILGASYGIGKIGSSAVESMARQPEVAGAVQMAMVIAAALIEGVTFFALIVCWMK
ncbi:MAG: ATP synthase F0 subunit C [Pirellulales bacterium]|nr:ATP synthase F0 subunit C [Pirellulales bacterium]